MPDEEKTSYEKFKENKLVKIIFGDVFRIMMASVFSFWAAKHAIGSEIAAKLNAGDTVAIWQGNVPLSLSLIVSFLVSVSMPLLLPLIWGVWSRVYEAYKLLVSRANKFATSRDELREQISTATPLQILQSVAVNEPKTV